MANAIYPKWIEAILQASSNSSLGGTVKAALVDAADYTYNSADQFYSSVSAAVVGTPQTIGSKTFTAGVFDGADVTFPSVTGDACEAIVIFIDTGTPSTSRLVAHLDTGYTLLPVAPNGGNISIAWNASGIFSL